MKLLTFLFFTALCWGALPSAAQAQSQAQSRAQSTNCGTRTAIIDRLFDRFGETRQSVGLGANNAMVEVFASTSTGTWTILVTIAGGRTCLVASGQSFETVAAGLPLQDDDA